MQKNVMRNLATLICITSLTLACAVGPQDPEHSPYYKIPVASSLVLHRDLSIPANQAAVFIQNGEVKNFKDIDKYYPYCKFEVRTIMQNNQTIKADTFIIHRSTTDETIVQKPQSVFRRVSMDDGGGGPSFIEMFRIMYLRSEQQPDVLRLSCGHRAISPNYDHLTVSEVRQALGKLMTLKAPGQQ